MIYCAETAYQFPPLGDWTDTQNTLHRFLQIVGKIRLRYHPKLNHWWHVTFYPSARGITTGRIPYCEREFEIEFDFIEHVLRLRTSEGEQQAFSLPGLSVAEFYHRTLDSLESFGLPVRIYPYPYLLPGSEHSFAEDTIHKSYDSEAAHKYWQALSQVANIFEEFRGRFLGKSTPVHLFWHSFDLALTRFSGRKAPPLQAGTPVDQEAYSHEVISFGFWPGDPTYPQPAFYSYTYPMPDGLAGKALEPDIAFWGEYRGSPMVLMNYEDFRLLPNPHEALLAYLETAYQSSAKQAHWPVEELALHP